MQDLVNNQLIDKEYCLTFRKALALETFLFDQDNGIFAPSGIYIVVTNIKFTQEYK